MEKTEIWRLKGLDEICKIYTYASLGEKNRIENEIMKMYTNKKYSTEKALHTFAPFESDTHFCTAPNSTIQRKFVEHFRIKFFEVLVFKRSRIVCNCCPKIRNADENFAEF